MSYIAKFHAKQLENQDFLKNKFNSIAFLEETDESGPEAKEIFKNMVIKGIDTAPGKHQSGYMFLFLFFRNSTRLNEKTASNRQRKRNNFLHT